MCAIVVVVIVVAIYFDCRRTMRHTLTRCFFIYIPIMKCKQTSSGEMRAGANMTEVCLYPCGCKMMIAIDRACFLIWSAHRERTPHRRMQCGRELCFWTACGDLHSIVYSASDDKLSYLQTAPHSLVNTRSAQSQAIMAQPSERERDTIIQAVSQYSQCASYRYQAHVKRSAQKINFHDDKLHKYVNKL